VQDNVNSDNFLTKDILVSTSGNTRFIRIFEHLTQYSQKKIISSLYLDCFFQIEDSLMNEACLICVMKFLHPKQRRALIFVSKYFREVCGQQYYLHTMIPLVMVPERYKSIVRHVQIDNLWTKVHHFKLHSLRLSVNTSDLAMCLANPIRYIHFTVYWGVIVRPELYPHPM